MIFSVSDSFDNAQKISASSFAHLNVWERQHIEEWVRTNPEILGEDLLLPPSLFGPTVGILVGPALGIVSGPI